MHPTATCRLLAAGLLAWLLTAGCAAAPELVAKNSSVPAGVDLSGYWQLRQEPGVERKAPTDSELKIRIPAENSIGRRASETRPRRSSSGPSAGLFLENGEMLKITQTSQGLFVSFDRAIVEVYTFGEKRLVSIGPIEAQRVSGWENDRFVVETLDDKGAVLTESWRLEGDGDELLRDITLVDKNRPAEVIRQRFDRRIAE